MKMYIQLILMTLIPIHYCQIDFQTICQAGIRQDNTNYIHCGRKQLNDIPNFSRTTNTVYDELVLNDNQITQIPRNAFQGLRVKRLNLSGNKIRSIDPRAFVELANYLEELIIEFDSSFVHDIPPAIKFNLINLRSLKLIGLNLTTIANHTFVKYRKLEDLSILKSNVQQIEADAFHSMHNLRALHLDHNQLSDHVWFDLTKYLLNLETLTLSQNNFHYLKEAFLSKHLKILDLSSNGIQIVEKKFFGKLSSLEKLSLQNNEINSLQLTFLSVLPRLKELNLDFNRLTFLPENLFQSNSKLAYLSLQGNDLNYLTNKSFRGLKQLTYLNLARNRLQFQANQQPFEDLNSLEILNLDRNNQLNLSKTIFHGLQNKLLELSLQNCNLTTLTAMNNPFHLLTHLQRLKLASNNFKKLPDGFLSHLTRSLISIDLQRNHFRAIPNLFGKDFNSSKLTDFDLSSNQICTLESDDLYQYKNLKTIGLTGNPLHCDCHLRWLKQWLIKNYDYDLINFLQWTCATPTKLSGKQLTIIDEQDMSCKETEPSKCEERSSSLATSTTTQSSTSIQSTTTLPFRSSSSPVSSSSSFDELVINDISYNPNGMLTITWDYMLLTLPRYIHLQIYDENTRRVILQRLIDGEQRSIEIDIKDYLQEYSSIYMVCLNIRHNKYCRNIQLDQIKSSSSLILSSNTPDNPQSLQFVYLLGGVFLGAVFVCVVLIVVCCWRIRRLSREPVSNSIEKLPANTFYQQPPPHSSIFYRPLNIISYPQPSHQQSCDTSECSIHSSTDTSQVASDSYHVYQQIPSVYNCQIHPSRTHILI